MQITTEIPDISRDEVIEAMARQLLTEWHEDDPETGPHAYPRASKLGEQMKRYLDDKIAGLADVIVREQFDVAIKDRINAAVDEALAEGWQKTDSYGCAVGPKIDLKGRISEALTKPDGGYGRPTLVDMKIKESVTKALDQSFAAEIEAAKKRVRAEIEGVLSGKVTEALKGALGIR